MNYPSPRVPDQDAAAHERPDRPNQWILDLGLEVHSGRRPWLRPLVAAAMTLVPPVLLRTIGDLDRGETPPDPDLVAVTDRLTGLATVLALILAAVLVVASVAYWVLCRYAHGVWKSLPEDERETLVRERVEGLRRAIVALGGEDPDVLPIRQADLENLSDRHRHLLEDLQACSEQAASHICTGARARTDDLVMAGMLHRALSKDTIVHPPHSATSSTDPRVLALTELDQELHATASSIRESLESGRCTCGDQTHDRLIGAGDRAHALLHGLDPNAPAVELRPRWVTSLIWAGVVIAIAALPIGLLTTFPSVVISALGLSVTVAGLVGEITHRGAARTPLDRLRHRVFIIAWVVIVVAAAATLLA